MNYPIFDLHCDTAYALLSQEDWMVDKRLKSNKLHIDLDRAAKLPGYCQCFACFTTPLEKLPPKMTVIDLFERELNGILNEIGKNPDMIQQAFSADDIRTNQEKGIMSAVLTIEGPAGFGFDPALLEMMHGVGFRISTLGWNEQNELIGSHKTGGGLTDLGREYVKECQRLGLLVDVSHCSDAGFWDIMDMTQAPVIASHSNSRGVWDTSRNLTDDMFKAICRTGGVAGINLYDGFLGDHATLDTVCDHIFHFLEMDPEGEHIAFGGDLDGCESLPEGFAGVESYPDLVQRMLQRGIGEKIMQNICWNNALGVMERAVRCHQK